MSNSTNQITESEIQMSRVDGVLVGLKQELSSEVMHQLVSLCGKEKAPRRGGVVGPKGIERHVVEGLGRIVIKHYVRGGLIRYLFGRRYFGLTQFRSKSEFLMLETVRNLGISAPKPIAFIVQGAPFYKTWLIMTELEGVIALADLASAQDISRCQGPLEALASQVERLIEHRVFHVDLHPGNVVVDSMGQVYILDFDKAEVFTGPLNALRDKYLQRWRRSVIKHNLPEFFAELFSARLRKRFDVCHTM